MMSTLSNYDRLFREIEEESKVAAPSIRVEPDVLVSLTMEIVNIEDQHSLKRLNVKQQMQDKILAVTANIMAGDQE